MTITTAIQTDVELAALLNDIRPENRPWMADSVETCEGYDLAVWVEGGAEADAVLSAIRYFAVSSLAMAGEAPDAIEEVIPGQLFILYVDTTKSQRDDVADAFAKVYDFALEGSPVRKTDRSGPGTKGTRAVEGIGRILCAWN